MIMAARRGRKKPRVGRRIARGRKIKKKRVVKRKGRRRHYKKRALQMLPHNPAFF